MKANTSSAPSEPRGPAHSRGADRLLALLRRERVAALIIAVLLLGAGLVVGFSLTRPEPPSYVPADTAQLVDAASGTRRFTIDASHERNWRFASLSAGRVLERPGARDWDLAFRRFHIATNGGPGFSGQGSAGPVTTAGEAVLQQTSRDTTKSGFGKWYDYGFSSHLLMPKPLTYAVVDAAGARYTVRILSYYCPGAQPGCITFDYTPAGTY